MTVRPPSDRELRTVLERQLGSPIRSWARRPFDYASSAPLEILDVETEDGVRLDLVFKDLAPERMLDDARRHKPTSTLEPRRAVVVQRRLLDGLGVGPRCIASVLDDAAPCHWLFLERVTGPVLWQVGDLEVWHEVARWLGDFHRAMDSRVRLVVADIPELVQMDAAWFEGWWERAERILTRSRHPRGDDLRRWLRDHRSLAGVPGELPRTIVHGEFVASNVLVDRLESPRRVLPIDWESAGLGCGLVDLAALVAGWPADEAAQLADAYGTVDREAFEHCRLHCSLRWIGWSPDWEPPAEHATDWIEFALESASFLDG